MNNGMVLTSFHIDFVFFAEWLVVGFDHVNRFIRKRYRNYGTGITEKVDDTSVC